MYLRGMTKKKKRNSKIQQYHLHFCVCGQQQQQQSKRNKPFRSNFGSSFQSRQSRRVIMASKVTAEFKKEFNQLLELRSVTANEQLQKLLECLRSHKFLYSVDSINAKYFLAHKANRGGLLLSPHNVHRNAARIHRCGADLKQLNNALCMELAAHGAVREEHLAKNALLVERAAGLLAPINGSERYVTLGCGHTTAFCKLAATYGRTSETALKLDGSDKIDVQKICANPNFRTMLLSGGIGMSFLRSSMNFSQRLL
jgi:hypothetical protein